MAINRIDNVVLVVPDLQRGSEWYEGVLGMRPLHKGPDVHHYSCGSDHAEVSLVTGHTSFGSFTFGVDADDDLHQLAAALRRENVPHEMRAGETRPGEGKTLQFATPAGQTITGCVSLDGRKAGQGSFERHNGVGPCALDHINLLGNLAPEVMRDFWQAIGFPLYRRIEYIRSASVDRHRGVAAGDAVDPGLDALSLDETLAFTRGFMLFSMLANLAEDRHGVAAEPGSTLAAALDLLTEKGVDKAAVSALLDRTLVAPVLTAHPTEVRRKSMLDHRNRIAELMQLRDAGNNATDDGDPIEDVLIRHIALLWNTRPLRREKLYVTDEVETALSYMRDIFLPVLPALYARWEKILGSRPPAFLRLGSWIGGDRDGNPFVDAASLRLALGRSCETVLVHYLDTVHALGAELSISNELAPVTPALEALANASGDAGEARRDEPYRRALSGIYARLAATHFRLVGRAPPRASRVPAKPYPDVEAFRADLITVETALAGLGDGLLSGAGPLTRLVRAVDIFGFHLATLDIRQNSDVHQRVIGELLASAGVEPDYAALDEAARITLLRRTLAEPRLLAIHREFADSGDCS